MPELEMKIKTMYLKAPPLEETLSFVEELGISDTQFERFYKMGKGMMKQIRNGYKPLPTIMWPIVFEKIVPQYGKTPKEINEIFLGIQKEVTKNVTKYITRTTPRNLYIDDSHDRLNKV